MTDRPRRLAPAERRTQLLDYATEIIAADGIAECTIDAVAQRADVTPQLVHKYFGTRSSLLSELLEREYGAYAIRLEERLAGAASFDDIVRVFVEANFDQLSDRTVIGQLIKSADLDPTVATRIRRGDRKAGTLLAKAMSDEYPAEPEIVELILRMGSAASIAAGNVHANSRRTRPRGADVDDAVRFILGGVRALTSTTEAAER